MRLGAFFALETGFTSKKFAWFWAAFVLRSLARCSHQAQVARVLREGRTPAVLRSVSVCERCVNP